MIDDETIVIYSLYEIHTVSFLRSINGKMKNNMSMLPFLFNIFKRGNRLNNLKQEKGVMEIYQKHRQSVLLLV